MTRALLVILALGFAAPLAAEARSVDSAGGVQSAGAQVPPPQRQGVDGQRNNRRGGARGPGAATTVQDVERMWDTFVTAQARTALGLNDEAQFLRFGVQLQNLQNLRRRLQRQQNMLQRELMRLGSSGQDVDRAEVTAALAEYDGFAVRSAQLVRRAYAAIDAELTLGQRVRFRTFERRMAQRKLELLAQARANARGRGGGRPEPAIRR